VSKAADKIADTLNLNSSSAPANTATAVTGAAATDSVTSSTTAASAAGHASGATPTPTVITGPNLATLDVSPGHDQHSKLAQQQHKGYNDVYAHSVKPAGLSHSGAVKLPSAAAAGAPEGPDVGIDSQDVGVPDGLKTLLQHTGTQQPSRITIRTIHHLP
jgi:hypothetical protein